MRRCRTRSTTGVRPPKGSHVHCLGVAYKRDIDDIRESPALDIIHLLVRRGAIVTFSDPFVSSIRVDGHMLFAVDILPTAAEADCSVIITDHTDVDYNAVLEASPLVVDTRNALRGARSEKIIRL